MILGLTDLRQIIILSEGPVLAHELESADKVVIALNQFLNLRRGSTLIRLLFAFIGLAHRQTSD